MSNEPHLSACEASYRPQTPLKYLLRTLEVHLDRPAWFGTRKIVLLKHLDVLLAAVVAIWGEKSSQTPLVPVNLSSGRKVRLSDLNKFCKSYLAGFKRPRHFVFEKLPPTDPGKIQKFMLQGRARDGEGS